MPGKTVTTGTRILYAVGAAANSVRTVLFGLFSLFFYSSLMGVPGTLVGLGGAISLLWDAVIDPYIGTVSDRRTGRLGKRHGLMLLGSLTMGVAFWAFFNPPTGLPMCGVFAWAVASGILVRTATSLFVVPYYALGAELTDDYHDRTSIVAMRSVFALLSSLVTVVLSLLLFLPSDVQADPELTIEGYHGMGIFAGLVMTGAGLVATLGTLGERRYAPDGATASSMSTTVRGLGRDLTNALRVSSFRIVFLSYSLAFLGTVVNASMAMHFLNYYMDIRSGTALAFYQLSFYVGAMLGVIFWAHYAKKVEKRILYFGGTMATALAMSGAFFLFGEGGLLGTGNLSPLLVGNGLAGFCGSVLWVMPASMLADVIDEDEFQTGRRQEGTIFGLISFGEQIAASGAILLTGILMDVFVGLQVGAMEQSRVTVERIGILYGVIPAVILLASALSILRYRLTEDRVLAYQAALSKR
jgi:Na+/melibiose symporter-like transporter